MLAGCGEFFGQHDGHWGSAAEIFTAPAGYGIAQRRAHDTVGASSPGPGLRHAQKWAAQCQHTGRDAPEID